MIFFNCAILYIGCVSKRISKAIRDVGKIMTQLHNLEFIVSKFQEIPISSAVIFDEITEIDTFEFLYNFST